MLLFSESYPLQSCAFLEHSTSPQIPPHPNIIQKKTPPRLFGVNGLLLCAWLPLGKDLLPGLGQTVGRRGSCPRRTSGTHAPVVGSHRESNWSHMCSQYSMPTMGSRNVGQRMDAGRYTHSMAAVVEGAVLHPCPGQLDGPVPVLLPVTHLFNNIVEFDSFQLKR